MYVHITHPKTPHLLQFTGLLQLVNKLQQACQLHQVATSLLRSGLLQLVICRLFTNLLKPFAASLLKNQLDQNKSVDNLQQAR